MADFIRARSAEQKAQRFEQIKAVARRQFSRRPYYEITLTTLAEELGWSRASLYRYVSTKEEIFLLIAGDECAGYFDALLAVLPDGPAESAEALAEVWADVADAHRDWFRVSDLLPAVVEANVTTERLAAYKLVYHDHLERVVPRVAAAAGVTRDQALRLVRAVTYHAIGVAGRCRSNPVERAALDSIGVSPEEPDFRSEVARFARAGVAGLTCGE